MALRDLDYQTRVLDRLNAYLTELAAQKAKADKIAASNAGETDPDLIRPVPNFPATAWRVLRESGRLPPSRAGIPYSPRTDGMGRPVPNVLFKVPTGGGKTYLAVSALSHIFGRYLGRSTGFVLWIVPNEAIYSQTRRHLMDRQHPYRQLLDVLSGNRLKLMEKGDRLDARDVEANLCVMLLMLQSANREGKETLRLFRDRGDVRGFFPEEGDQEAHERLLREVPNLDAYAPSASSGSFWPMVKDSLGNALRLIRPVVVMDEGHRATPDLAFKTLYGFNPCFVLELTATPKDVAARGGKNPKPARYANLLVEVTGLDLDREGMIKMPLNLEPRAGADWHGALRAAWDWLNLLEAEARRLHGESGRYIRPILLVQVERTGAEQRDSDYIHALDAKDWLIAAGLDPAEIAIKTADTNDLANPENQDLLSPTNRIRAIITKQALQEGWDCPFAYVLCSLSASHSAAALTQLVGRILRQPGAQKTGVAALDECYVVTHHADTARVLAAIKEGLERDGLADLVEEIRVVDDDGGGGRGPRKIPRRPAFATTEVYLPRVLHVADGGVRDLDYEQDILYALDWDGVDPAPLADAIPTNADNAERQLGNRLRRIRLADGGEERIVSELAERTGERLEFDPAYAVRMVSDLVPNAWVAREIIGAFVARLKGRGVTDEWLGRLHGLLIEELRKWLTAERDRMAEALFRREVAAGTIQFRLRTDAHNWSMPMHTWTSEPAGAEQLPGMDGAPLQRSLFAPIYKGDLNGEEREVAVYLDAERSLIWWHRNVARKQYGLQGWRRERVYPDFIFAVQPGERYAKGKRLVVMETKGDQLMGNLDTEYKRALLAMMTEAFQLDQTQRIGEVALVHPDGTTVECDLVTLTEWQTRLPEKFGA